MYQPVAAHITKQPYQPPQVAKKIQQPPPQQPLYEPVAMQTSTAPALPLQPPPPQPFIAKAPKSFTQFQQLQQKQQQPVKMFQKVCVWFFL